MAHSHFVMDLHYREENNPERFRREVLRIEAKDDAEAETEGRRIDAWRKPAFFVIRAIQTSPRGREKLVFDSRTEHEPAPAETAEPAAASATAPLTEAVQE